MLKLKLKPLKFKVSKMTIEEIFKELYELNKGMPPVSSDEINQICIESKAELENRFDVNSINIETDQRSNKKSDSFHFDIAN